MPPWSSYHGTFSPSAFFTVLLTVSFLMRTLSIRSSSPGYPVRGSPNFLPGSWGGSLSSLLKMHLFLIGISRANEFSLSSLSGLTELENQHPDTCLGRWPQAWCFVNRVFVCKKRSICKFHPNNSISRFLLVHLKYVSTTNCVLNNDVDTISLFEKV